MSTFAVYQGSHRIGVVRALDPLEAIAVLVSGSPADPPPGELLPMRAYKHVHVRRKERR